MSKSKIKGTPKSYTADFKEEAVKLITEQNYTLSDAADRLGVSKSALSKWKQALLNEGNAKSAFPGKGYLKPDDAAFKELQKEVERLRRERDILKKAMAYFANPQG
jgi:transposase